MKAILVTGLFVAMLTLVAQADTTMTVETAKGKIVIKLNPDGAPNTVKNLKSKADSGFYNGLKFHRVEDWVIQGGDPTGTGAGGGKIPAEYNKTPFKRGSVGIARGPDRSRNSDCQWFVCKKDAAWLDGDYTNVGEVVSGMEIVDGIAQGDKMTKITITESAPATQPAEKGK